MQVTHKKQSAKAPKKKRKHKKLFKYSKGCSDMSLYLLSYVLIYKVACIKYMHMKGEIYIIKDESRWTQEKTRVNAVRRQHCMPPNSTNCKCNRGSIDKLKYKFKYSTATRKTPAMSLEWLIFAAFYDLLRRWSPIIMRSQCIYKKCYKNNKKQKIKQIYCSTHLLLYSQFRNFKCRPTLTLENNTCVSKFNSGL